jgi:hypothetical protein
VEVDFTKVDRSIAREPKYISKPQYALFIFDPQAKFSVWAVLDKSKPDLPYYDVLYFDKNGNGDLTEAGKRFVGHYDEQVKELSIVVGELHVPGVKLTHTNLRFVTVERHGYKGIYFGMKWNGKVLVDGGYGNEGTVFTTYSLSPQQAPILRPTPLGPLTFRFWDAQVSLPRGQATDVQLGLGSAGSGPDTFCAVSEHYLVPGKDTIVATLIGKDSVGKELLYRTEIKKHC